MGGADWLLPVFLHVATMHENGTVRKLLTVHQQVSTTRTEVTCLCLGQLTKLLVLLFLPVNVVSFLPLTVPL